MRPRSLILTIATALAILGSLIEGSLTACLVGIIVQCIGHEILARCGLYDGLLARRRI